MTMNNTTTRMDVYVKGEKVFSFVRGQGEFTVGDVKIKVSDSNEFNE